jgi:predicted GNAT superfamily acetyltransferase
LATGRVKVDVVAGLLEVSVLTYPDRSYAQAVDDARRLVGAPNNAALFPGHFLKASFPKIGGRVALLRAAGQMVGAGFLFPRALPGGQREYTLQLHRALSDFNTPASEVAKAVERAIGAAIHCYEPTSELSFSPPMPPDEYIGRPGADAAREVRELQNRIWAPPSADGLYPVDMHSLDFGPGTSLLARIDGSAVGFLFGFYKFGGAALPPLLAERHSADFRLESQLMGVLHLYRRRSVAVDLKRRQAELARGDEIHVVNWTFDPLQYGNAHLNFCRLGGVAFDFSPNYYDFANQLNVAPASRLSVTWLIRSARVHWALAGAGQPGMDLRYVPDVVRLNDGPERVAMANGARRIAIEIPADWTGLQGAAATAAEAGDARPLETVLAWRRTTDQILGECVGASEGRYALTGTGRDGDRRYLVGERVDEALLGILGE